MRAAVCRGLSRSIKALAAEEAVKLHGNIAATSLLSSLNRALTEP
jgi:hypothetical protein